MTPKPPTRATAFAPATVGNVAVGFDILGFATESVGDEVIVRRTQEKTVTIGTIEGVVKELPKRAEENTATVGLLKMLKDLDPGFGFHVDIKKGIPLGSGMGGSAASAVGAVVAAAALLDQVLTKDELLKYALAGEEVASGAVHGDNVAPCLLGGLVLIRSLSPIDIVSIPVPKTLYAVLVKPELRIDTRRAREILPRDFPLQTIIAQSANLAGFIAGCFQEDLELIGRSLKDVLIEPYRSQLLPGFADAHKAAIDTGALGASLSGSGPALFALARDKEEALRVSAAMAAVFAGQDVATQSWAAPISPKGTTVTSID